MRINARLDDTHAQKLDYLKRATHSTVSDIVKTSLDLYYDQVRGSSSRAAEVLERSGFIGCGASSPDLSTSYKEELAESLAAKHGLPGES